MVVRQLRLTPDGRLDAPSLIADPRVARMMALLNREGEETRLVGGSVRNALLGLPAGDIDLATTAHPDAVMARARRAKLRTIPTGLSHGTVTVLDGGVPFEVTTLREDVETDGRHATVRFGRDFSRDAERRDFTVNALSVGQDWHALRHHERHHRPCGRADPLHRRRGDPHPGRLPPHPAVLSLSRHLRARRPRCGGPRGRGGATRRPRRAVAREGPLRGPEASLGSRSRGGARDLGPPRFSPAGTRSADRPRSTWHASSPKTPPPIPCCGWSRSRPEPRTTSNIYGSPFASRTPNATE